MRHSIFTIVFKTRTFRGSLVVLLLALLVGVIYGEVLSHDFIELDDRDYVADNPKVRSGLSADGVRWAFTTFHAANWHPLTWLSHMADVSLFGMQPGRHLAVNVLLHLANGILLFIALLRISGALGRSMLVSALFVVHPLHVESVAWLSERKDLLCALFWILALIAYRAYAARGRGPARAGVLAAYLLGLLAKPMIITLPFLLLLLDVWPLKRMAVAPDLRGARQRMVVFFSLLAEKAPLFLLAGGAAVMTVLAQRSHGAFYELPFTLRMMNAVVAYATYLLKAIYPWPLAVYYAHPGTAEGLLPMKAAAALAALTLVSALCLIFRRRRPWLPIGWFWYLGTLVPVIGLVQVGNQASADRYTYVPLIGIFILCVWEGAELARSRPALRFVLGAVAAAVVITFAWIARNQVAVWRTSETLFTHALRVAEESRMVHDAFGRALQRDGRISEAIGHYEAALRIVPNSAITSNRLGAAYNELGRPADAMKWFQRAVALDPRYAPARFNLGMAYHQFGNQEAALEEYRQLVALGEPRAADLLARISK